MVIKNYIENKLQLMRTKRWQMSCPKYRYTKKRCQQFGYLARTQFHPFHVTLVLILKSFTCVSPNNNKLIIIIYISKFYIYLGYISRSGNPREGFAQ